MRTRLEQGTVEKLAIEMNHGKSSRRGLGRDTAVRFPADARDCNIWTMTLVFQEWRSV